MIKYAIFDLDGTLLDTLTTITYYVNLVLRRGGIREISEEECKYFVGNGAKTLIKRTLESREIFDEDLSFRVWKEYNREYNLNTLYLTEPYEEIRELLSLLRDKGVKLAVLSNKPDDTTRNIIPSFFPDTFDVVHGGREGIMLKPSPDGVFEIYREMGALPEETIYIGDTNVDMQTGKSAGAKVTVGVSWGFRTKDELIDAGADVVVDRPLEILNLIN